MNDFKAEMYGEPGSVEHSVGYRDWLQKRGRGASRPIGAVGERPQAAPAVAGSRFSMLRRDLDQMEATARVAMPLPASLAVSLLPDARGHFYANTGFGSTEVRMMIDTGATFCSLTEEDADRVGIQLRSSDFIKNLSTQNGYIRVAPVLFNALQVGKIRIYNVEATVSRRVSGGESLLGMSFLKRLRQFSMERGRLILRG